MINKEIPKRLGAKIRYIRQLQKLSQIELAGKSGLNFNYIGQIERAETNPSLQTLTSIAEGFGVEIKELFDFSF